MAILKYGHTYTFNVAPIQFKDSTETLTINRQNSLGCNCIKKINFEKKLEAQQKKEIGENSFRLKLKVLVFELLSMKEKKNILNLKCFIVLKFKKANT